MEPDLKQAGFAVCLRYFSIYHRFICISLHSIFFNHNILDNKNCTGLVIRIIYPDFQTWKYLPFFASYFPKAAETLDFLASSRFPYLPSNSPEFGNPERTRKSHIFASGKLPLLIPELQHWFGSRISKSALVLAPVIWLFSKQRSCHCKHLENRKQKQAGTGNSTEPVI